MSQKTKLFVMPARILNFFKALNVNTFQKQICLVDLSGKENIFSIEWSTRLRNLFSNRPLENPVFDNQKLITRNGKREQSTKRKTELAGPRRRNRSESGGEVDHFVTAVTKRKTLKNSTIRLQSAAEKLKKELEEIGEPHPHLRCTPQWKRKQRPIERWNDLQKFRERRKREGFSSIPPWLPLAPGCRPQYHVPPPAIPPKETEKFLYTVRPPWVKFSCRSEKSQLTNNAERQYHTLRAEEAQKPSKHAVTPAASTKIYPGEMKHLKTPKNQVQLDAVPKMKALLFDPDSLKINLSEVDAPRHIFKDEVLIQVVYSGVSGTDLLIKEGKLGCGREPRILGHEFCGKVYAVGSDVSHIKVGDDVAVNPYTACGVCRYCNRGLHSSCLNEATHNLIGVTKHGSWAEYVVVKRGQVYKLPTKIGLEQAVLIEPLSCVLSALIKMDLSNDLEILIQGLGLSGCLWASVLHSKGFRNVLVSDKSIKKLQRLKSLNLGYDFIPPEEVGRSSADVVIECTGFPTSIETCLGILNPNGQICFFKKPSPNAKIRFSPYEIVRKEITVVGNTGNAFGFPRAIDLAKAVGHRYLDFERLGVGVFELRDFRKAFQMKKSGDVGKIMFTLEN